MVKNNNLILEKCKRDKLGILIRKMVLTNGIVVRWKHDRFIENYCQLLFACYIFACHCVSYLCFHIKI